MKRKIKFKDIVLAILTYGWLILSVAVVLAPLLWMISASFTKGKLLSGVPVVPDFQNWTLDHYRDLFTFRSNPAQPYSDYLGAFLRTLIVAIINTVGVVLVSSITGFAFARYRFKGKKQLLLAMMLLSMFPSFMGMIALFLLFRSFGLLNNPYALPLIYVTGSIPYNTFLVRGFMRNIPRSLDEAAAIDGASNVQILTKVIIPLTLPIIGFLAVGAFMGPWMDFILQSRFLQPERMLVSMWLYRTIDPFNTMYYSPLTFMAGALLLAIPIMMVQMYMQKYVIYGLTAGADKG